MASIDDEFEFLEDERVAIEAGWRIPWTVGELIDWIWSGGRDRAEEWQLAG